MSIPRLFMLGVPPDPTGIPGQGISEAGTMQSLLESGLFSHYSLQIPGDTEGYVFS
jgi:hypothetical protein